MYYNFTTVNVANIGMGRSTLKDFAGFTEKVGGKKRLFIIIELYGCNLRKRLKNGVDR